MVFVLGECNQIRFWYDPWSDHLPIKDIYLDLFDSSADKGALASNVLDPPSQGTLRSCNLCFHWDIHDWEMKAVCSFLDHIYTKLPRGVGDDKLQKLTGIGNFNVCSFYNAICGTNTHSFLWKNIWHAKVPVGCHSFCGQLHGV